MARAQVELNEGKWKEGSEKHWVWGMRVGMRGGCVEGLEPKGTN